MTPDEMKKAIKDAVEAATKDIHAKLTAVTGELDALKKAQVKPASPETKERTPVETRTTTGKYEPPKEPHSLNADWFGDRNLPDGYNDVVWKKGQRTAYLKSAAGKAAAPLLGLGSLALAGESVVSSIPLLGKIPYLPQFAGWLQSTTSSLAAPLGLSTGVNATNAVFAGLPAATGPIMAGALAIPAGLAGIGYLKGLVLGRRYGGFWNNVRAGAAIPFQAPAVAYRLAMSARERAWTFTKKAADVTIGAPARYARKMTAEYAWPAVKPNRWSVGGALLGTSLALFSGGSVPVTAAAGYFGMKAFRKLTGIADRKPSAAAAHA